MKNYSLLLDYNIEVLLYIQFDIKEFIRLASYYFKDFKSLKIRV